MQISEGGGISVYERWLINFGVKFMIETGTGSGGKAFRSYFGVRVGEQDEGGVQGIFSDVVLWVKNYMFLNVF